MIAKKVGKKCIYTQVYFYFYLQEAEGSENGQPSLPQVEVQEGSAVGVYSSFLKESNNNDNILRARLRLLIAKYETR